MDSNWYPQIELYLAGELDAEELARFNQALQTEPGLAEALEEYRAAGGEFEEMMTEDQREPELAAQLKTLGREYITRPRPAPVRSMKKWYAGIAAAAAIVLFFAARLLFFGGPSLQKLYSDNYNPYSPELSYDRSGGGRMDSLLRRADSIYRLEKYQESIPLYQQYLQQNDSLENAGFALGTAFFLTNRHDSAVVYFKKMENAFPTQRNQALWYQAMVKLKEEDRAGCKALLKQMSEKNDSRYFELAEKLLKDL